MRFLVFNIVISLLVAAVSMSAAAEIYRWVDENGVTHFSEKKPANKAKKVEDISGRLKDVGNLVTFVDPGPIDFYQPKRAKRDANVDIQMEMFDYEMTAEQRRHVNEQVNGLYKAYVRWFDWIPTPTHQVKIKIFGNYKAFEQHQLEHRGKLISNRSH